MTPQLRFPQFTDEWQVKKLGDIAELTSSKRVYLSDYVPSGIPFYRGKEISELKKNIVPDDILYISSSTYENFKSKFGAPQKNEILITAVGTLGNVLRVKNDEPFYFKDGNLIWLKNIQEDPFFTEIILENGKNKLLQSAIGSSQKALTIVGLNKIKFKFPRKAEQEKIAEFLTAVDERIALMEKKLELLKKYKKGVMQKIFTQQIRFKDENGDLYPDWEEKKLGEVLKIGSGRDYKHLKKGDIPVYGTGGLMLRVNDYLYDGKSICIGRKGTIDKPQFLSGKFWTVDTLFYTYDYKNSVPEFIYLIFQKINWQKYNEASGVPSLSKTTIEKIKINMPSEGEQRKIAAFTGVIDDRIELGNKKLQQAKRFKKSLLQRMFV